MTDSPLLRFLGQLYVAVLLCPVYCSVAQEAASIDLARRYVSLRPSVLKASAGAASIKPDEFRSALSAVSGDALRRYRKGPDWGPAHPEWKRVAGIIESDIQEVVQQISSDPNLADLAKDFEEMFIRGMSSRLSQAELNALVLFYTSSEGIQLAHIQQKLFDEIAPAVGARQLQMMSGQKPATVEPFKNSDEEVKQLLGLYDEWVRIQWALADPGPKRDRSGLQAIPFMVLISIQTHFAQYLADWRSISENDRNAILNWRESGLGKKERDVIYQTVMELKPGLNIDANRQRIMAKLVAYDEKWRVIIQSTK